MKKLVEQSDESILYCAEKGAIISSNRENKKKPRSAEDYRNSDTTVSLILEFLADSSTELSSIYLRLAIAMRCSRDKKKKKKSRLNDDHWYKRRVTRGNVQIGCSCKCQMVEWIVGRMVTATFFIPKYAQNEGNGPARTFNFDAETRCLFRLVQGTPDTLISFIPTTRLMGSLTTRTYFLPFSLIDYRCASGENYKSIKHWNI